MKPSDTSRQDVLKLSHPPLPVVRIGFIGLGNRGLLTLERYMHIEGVEITALCDLREANLQQAQQILTRHQHPRATPYSGTNGWKKLCEDSGIHLVFICTDWLNHTPMAVYAMMHEKHVAIEVPAAMTVEECWQLVESAEKQRRHCMMLENCCYDPFTLTTLNMAQQNIFGEIMHAEGAYIHDLRQIYFAREDEGGFHKQWNRSYSMHHTGNPYPTHGLGPVCQILNIHRGDRMTHLVSMSTHQAGMTAYAKKKFGPESPEAKHSYRMGDMNTTLIRTQQGKSIMIQYNVSCPRPYSRLHTICGTEGYAQKYPTPTLCLDRYQNPLLPDQQKQLLKEYEHPFTTHIGRQAHIRQLPNEMNYIMDYRLIYCLRHGLPLDQDVYDAAEWSCLTELTERSVLSGNMPVEIPDFTRGAWNKLPRLEFEGIPT